MSATTVGPEGDLPPLRTAERAGRLRPLVAAEACDAVVVTDPVDIRYLTGFTGSSGVVVVDDAVTLVTDGRYEEQSALQLTAAGVDADVLITRTPATALAARLAGAGRVALQAEHVTWQRQREWAAALDAEVVATVGLVGALRAVKEPGEVARLRRAAAIADDALAATRGLLADRPTERRFARALEAAMLERGAEAPSFETIVASGPNSARPHARPSDRVVGSSGEPELVVVDFGATVDGYHSDMTRTLVVGDPTDDQAAWIAAVATAQRAGIAAVADGVPAAGIDDTCRCSLDAAGLGDAFVHGTGHGIGLVIHESPWLTTESTDALEAGNCVTVEPGVYLPGRGGVRIEDSVVVTADGCDLLTGAPYDLVP